MYLTHLLLLFESSHMTPVAPFITETHSEQGMHRANIHLIPLAVMISLSLLTFDILEIL